MTDIPAAARDRLADALMPPLLTPVRELACDGGATRKTLWRLHDGSLVESVLMGYPDRVTVCVSSQAGCGMGCPFCATGQAGLTRNLSTAEIVDQVVWFAGRRRERGGARFAGAAVPRGLHGHGRAAGQLLPGDRRGAAADAPAPEGLGLSQRHITVSTVGLVPAMRRLADEDLAVTLALSLHAPDDDLRDELVPVNQRWKVAEVLEAAWDYAARTGRRVSIEYALIRDVNDQPWRADLLGTAAGRQLAHVNLIPLNPTPGSRWDASPKPVEREFVRRLRAAGVADDGAGHPGAGDRRCMWPARGIGRSSQRAPETSAGALTRSRTKGGTVTSQGQRFRRRALRRGYKVDEVDAFLDRVEATLAGDPIGAPVSAQEVHDVVFRVRFGGYDEWQVDLHLDRVERQLGDLEERTGGFARPERWRPGDGCPRCATSRWSSAGRACRPADAAAPARAGRQMSGPPMLGNGMVPPMMAPPSDAPMSAPPMRPMSAPPMRPDVGAADAPDVRPAVAADVGPADGRQRRLPAVRRHRPRLQRVRWRLRRSAWAHGHDPRDALRPQRSGAGMGGHNPS